eukprot:1514851-Pyramimonas_sp.AAC.1
MMCRVSASGTADETLIALINIGCAAAPLTRVLTTGLRAHARCCSRMREDVAQDYKHRFRPEGDGVARLEFCLPPACERHAVHKSAVGAARRAHTDTHHLRRPYQQHIMSHQTKNMRDARVTHALCAHEN